MNDEENNSLDLLKNLVEPSIFDRIIHEVDASKIPSRYIEKIVVYYKDGSVIELSGQEIDNPMPVNMNISEEDLQGPYRLMKEVKVFIDTARLEKDINAIIDDMFVKFF